MQKKNLELESNDRFYYLKAILVVSICYFISLKYIFPGYFNPLVPHHTDQFDYYRDFTNYHLMDFLKSARVTGDFILSLVGMVDYKSVLIFVIVLTVLNVFLITEIYRKITGERSKVIYITIFSVLIFSHPGFYINYTYDIFSSISLTFFLLIILCWYNPNKLLSNKMILVLSVLTLLVYTSKETYAVSLIVFWAFQILINYQKKGEKIFSLKMLLISCLLLILTLLRSKLIGSAFVSFSEDPNSPYYVSYSIYSILKTFIYYFGGLFNPFIILILILILIFSFIKKLYFKEMLMFFFMGMVAYIPYSVLPNHIVPHYIWVAAPILFSIVLFAQIIFVKESKFKVVEILLLLILCLTFSTNLGYFEDYNKNNWAVKPEIINNNILDSIQFIDENVEPSDKILITGLYVSEETPYKSIYYIKDTLNVPVQLTVITNGIEDTTRYTKLKNMESVNIEEFDKIFAYSSEGYLINFYDKKEIQNAIKSEESIDLILIPDLEELVFNLSQNPNDWYLNLELGRKYLDVKNYDSAEQYLAKSIEIVGNQNPYPSFFMGQLLEELNDNDQALKYYKNALQVEPTNANFIAAVERLENRAE